MLTPKQLKKARLAKKMTVTELARALKMTVPFVSDLEKGNRNPSQKTLLLLGKVLDIPICICPHCKGEGVLIREIKARLPLYPRKEEEEKEE